METFFFVFPSSHHDDLKERLTEPHVESNTTVVRWLNFWTPH